MSDFQTSLGHGLSPMGPQGADIARHLTKASGQSKDMAQAAKDFESVLIHQLMQEMARTISDSGLINSSASEQTQGIFWSFLAQEVSDNGGLGMWKDIQRYCTGSMQTDSAPPTLEQEL